MRLHCDAYTSDAIDEASQWSQSRRQGHHGTCAAVPCTACTCTTCSTSSTWRNSLNSNPRWLICHAMSCTVLYHARESRAMPLATIPCHALYYTIQVKAGRGHQLPQATLVKLQPHSRKFYNGGEGAKAKPDDDATMLCHAMPCHALYYSMYEGNPRDDAPIPVPNHRRRRNH